jgi:hypothetical protein
VQRTTEAGPRRISDLRRAKPADATLENLLQLLKAQLEMCARLTVYEYEAESDGHAHCAHAFRKLADVERESFESLLACLRRYLAEAAGDDLAQPEPAHVREVMA